ncbi:hypothetical protein FC683_10710 [Bacillus cereus]|uniref:hypothetical protein n=1 Tax=Bacillus cereus TaxID=1396 RepID=UPI0010BDC2CC|nr:hypothetical protein [Bacillus cereus]TKI35480.1 hypothetical protein FC683_10710 [Bacillus cereus]
MTPIKADYLNEITSLGKLSNGLKEELEEYNEVAEFINLSPIDKTDITVFPYPPSPNDFSFNPFVDSDEIKEAHGGNLPARVTDYEQGKTRMI